MTQSIIAALAILFVHACATEGMIFHPIAVWIEDNTPAWFQKPFITCVVCMSPWWGSLFWFVFGFEGNFLQYIFATCGLSCISGILIEMVAYDGIE